MQRNPRANTNNKSADKNEKDAAVIPPAMSTADRREMEQAEERQRLLKRALRDASEAQHIGHATNTTLAKQGEQIARVSTSLDKMDADLKVADYHTKSIGSWFGMIWNSMRGAPAEVDAKPNEAAAAAVASAAGNKSSAAERRTAGGSNSATTAKDDDDDEQVQDAEGALIDQLQHAVEGLRDTATKQNTVIKAQTEALAATGDQMDGVHKHMRNAGRNVNRLL